MGNLEKTRIVIIDGEAKWRNCLLVLLGEASGFSCVGVHASVDEMLRSLPVAKPEVVVLGFEVSASELLFLIQRLKGASQDRPLRVILFKADFESTALCSLLAAGADALVSKLESPLKLVEAVEAVRRGDAFISTSITRRMVDSLPRTEGWHRELDGLSGREMEVLKLLATGSTDQDMAVALGISVRTISTHLQHIYEKLDVHTRSAAVAKYLVGSAAGTHRVWSLQQPSPTNPSRRARAGQALVST